MNEEFSKHSVIRIIERCTGRYSGSGYTVGIGTNNMQLRVVKGDTVGIYIRVLDVFI